MKKTKDLQVHEGEETRMNPKLFFALMFGTPTVLLAWAYHDLGINSSWQLFLFCWIMAIGYMPGVIMYVYYIRYHVRDRVQKTLPDFEDTITRMDNWR